MLYIFCKEPAKWVQKKESRSSPDWVRITAWRGGILVRLRRAWLHWCSLIQKLMFMPFLSGLLPVMVLMVYLLP